MVIREENFGHFYHPKQFNVWFRAQGDNNVANTDKQTPTTRACRISMQHQDLEQQIIDNVRTLNRRR